MTAISMIDRKIPGFPLWTKEKSYKVLDKEDGEHRTVVRIKDDAGRSHWMAIGNTFIIES
jgi:hypothetical protein